MKHLKLYEEFGTENLDKHNIKKILDSYLETALWSSDEEDEKFDDFTIFDFTEKSIEDTKADITKFLNLAGNMLDEMPDNEIGHNFWLSRNGHGAGFFDRSEYYDEETGDKLQDIAKSFGEKIVEVSDDDAGKVSIH